MQESMLSPHNLLVQVVLVKTKNDVFKMEDNNDNVSDTGII